MTSERTRTAIALSVGVVAVATAAPLVVLAELPFLVVAAWRTLLCGLVYAAVAPRSLAALLELSRGRRRRAALGALLLAVHFGAWIAAFDHTSYAAAVLLLVTQPVFGALLGRFALGERQGAASWIAVLGSLVGLVLIVQPDLDNPGQLLGDALAVVGTLAYAAFFLVVGPLRRELPFAPFMAATYLGAGALLAAAAWLAGDPLTGHPAGAWAAVVALAVVPTVVGHACFNWAVPRVRFFTLNLLVVLEPALALLIGAVLLGSRVVPVQLAGGAVLGAAVLIGLRPVRTQRQPVSKTR